jgi:nicotinamidase-related amidase
LFGTNGWEIVEELPDVNKPAILKEGFGTLAWQYVPELADVDEIELVGLCTDICVMSNAIILKALYREKKISVNLDCTAATSKEAFDASITIFKSCQIELIGG